ncbi:hypothetical protein V1478_007287 [Vespula squamosa]|uniref:Uncharacterized protein n=1 Tax=Vespula squamosa TaxID=30214 RepID=A0ABD2B2P7_VESSQ
MREGFEKAKFCYIERCHRNVLKVVLTDPVDQSDTPRPNSMSLIVPRGAFNYSSTKCESVLTSIDEGLTNELADRIDSHKDHLNFRQSLCFTMQLVIETKVL